MPTPTEIFEQAACEIDAGQIQQGAKLAYEAAQQSLRTKARQHCKNVESDRQALEFARWLDTHDHSQEVVYDRSGSPMPPLMRVTSGFLTALAFKDHAETPLSQHCHDPIRFWEPDEYRYFLPSIARLIRLVKTITPTENALWTATATCDERMS